MDYEAVIGLEIHAQLKTESKIFCGCSTQFGDKPNSNTCAVCTGQPGALPVLNRLAVEYAAKAALALNLNINNTSIFARKNYFYPDLPKGYQISQYDRPFSEKGSVDLETGDRDKEGRLEQWRRKRIGITRLHIEEDAGKSLHEGMPESATKSYVDLNRSGTPLAEIVTDPDFRSSWEAYDFVQHLRRTLVYLDVCDGNMEEGNLRCDANVSVRPVGTEKFGNRVEIKNLNSFRFLQRAIDYEIKRQSEATDKGERIVQETRLWNERENKTYPMRSKEDAHDYRYFPEPDLPPLMFSSAEIERIRKSMPELSDAKRDRFIDQYGVSKEDANILTNQRELADYFEEVARISGNAKTAGNWVLNELLRELKNREHDITQCPVSAQMLGEMVKLIDAGTISGKIAKDVMVRMYETGKTALEVTEELGGGQINDATELERIANEVIVTSPKQVEQYRAGKTTLFGFFVGQVMKATQGKANPQLTNDLLKRLLD